MAQHAANLTEAEYALIAVPDEMTSSAAGTQVLAVLVCASAHTNVLAGRTIPVVGSTSGAVLADGVPRNVEQLEFDFTERTPVAFGPALALPLRTVDGETSGVLLAARGIGARPFGDEQMHLLSRFADQAALALQLAQDRAVHHELDLVADRDRIARKLHDHVIQRLFAVGLAMQRTCRQARLPAVSERLTDLRENEPAFEGLHPMAHRAQARLRPARRRRVLHAVCECT